MSTCFYRIVSLSFTSWLTVISPFGSLHITLVFTERKLNAIKTIVSLIILFHFIPDISNRKNKEIYYRRRKLETCIGILYSNKQQLHVSKYSHFHHNPSSPPTTHAIFGISLKLNSKSLFFWRSLPSFWPLLSSVRSLTKLVRIHWAGFWPSHEHLYAEYIFSPPLPTGSSLA